jgi:hypothetical protein
LLIQIHNPEKTGVFALTPAKCLLVGSVINTCLNEPQLTVGEEEEALADKVVGMRVAWSCAHQIALGLFKGEADGREEVGTEVDAEDSEDAEGEGQLCYQRQEEGGNLMFHRNLITGPVRHPGLWNVDPDSATLRIRIQGQVNDEISVEK